MGRFKHYDYGQMKMLPVSFEQQILPGTFEYTLNHLIDHEIDLECSRSAPQRRDWSAGRTIRRSCSRSSSTPIREGEEPQNRTAMPRERGVHGAQPIRPALHHDRFHRPHGCCWCVMRRDSLGGRCLPWTG